MKIDVRRYRTVAVCLFLGVTVLSLSACVPYPRYAESEKKLYIANKLNRDLENRLKVANVELASALGDEGMEKATFEALNERLEGYRIDNESLLEEVALLRAQLQEVPEYHASGFKKEDMDGIDGAKLVDGKVIMDSDLLFDSGKASLRKGARSSLDGLATIIKTKYSSNVIHLVGHTDNTPIKRSKHKDNWELASKRAHSVFSYLRQQGVPESNMRIHAFGYAQPFGDMDPDTKEGRTASRRVEIRLGNET